MAIDVHLRLFRRDDWAWIARCFQDKWLKRALGPMDSDWLDHVLQDRNGVQPVAMAGGAPVGCVGVGTCGFVCSDAVGWPSAHTDLGSLC